MTVFRRFSELRAIGVKYVITVMFTLLHIFQAATVLISLQGIIYSVLQVSPS